MRAHRYLFWTLAAYGLTILVAPVEPTFIVAHESVWLWAVTAALCVLGLLVGRQLRYSPVKDAGRGHFSLQRASSRVNLVGAFGLACTLIDRYALRGAPLGFDMFAAREALESSPSTLVGLVGALLGAFACFSLMLVVARAAVGERVTRMDWLASATLLLIYVGISIGLGSRSTLIVTVVSTMFSVLWLRKASGKAMHLRAWGAGLLVLLMVAVLSATLMLERLDQLGMDPFFSIQYSTFAYAIGPSDAAWQWLKANDNAAPFLAAVFSLLQYVFHGFYEFCLLAQQPFVAHTFGEVTFWLPLKFMNMFGLGLSPLELDDIAGWRSGTFTSFLGPLYLDFGPMLPFAGFVLFVVLGLPTARVSIHRLAMLPYCSILCALCVLFPVVNLLDSASGAYPMAASLLVPWLGNKRGSRVAGYRLAHA